MATETADAVAAQTAHASAVKNLSEESKTHTPILFSKDRRFGSVCAAAGFQKGADAHSIAALRDYVMRLGVNRVKLRSDGGAPIRALLDQVSGELRRRGIEVVPDKTPKGDSQAAGLQ